MTAAELLARADSAEAEALDAARRGDRDRAVRLLAEARVYREWAFTLTGGKRLPKMKRDMTGEHREAISRSTGFAHPALIAARKAGLRTLSDIAAALGVKKSFLSQVFGGTKAMPPERAEAFEKLTGYPANRWKR